MRSEVIGDEITALNPAFKGGSAILQISGTEAMQMPAQMIQAQEESSISASPELLARDLRT